MKRLFLNTFGTVLLGGALILGTESASMVIAAIPQSPWTLFSLLIFDTFFLITGYWIIKRNTRIEIGSFFSYKILLILAGVFVFGFGITLIYFTISGGLFSAFNQIYIGKQ